MQEHLVATTEFGLRLLVSGLLGAAIGGERQWRQRGTSIHTSALVALGATLFAMLAPAVNGDTRIVANIVTGVGFLAGGVILRQGANVTGLNTAATIWATAAVGACVGVGLYLDASMGALAIVAFNLALQPLVTLLDSRALVFQEEHGAKSYRLTVLCDEGIANELRRIIADSVRASKLNLRLLTAQSTEKGTEVRADFRLLHRDDGVLEQMSTTLSQHPGVRQVSWHILDTE